MILVVEDDPNDILLMERAFRKLENCPTYHFCSGGDEALEYLRGDPPYTDRRVYPIPTVVLLDVKMPRLTGFDVLEWIRGQPQLKALPVVMFTSSVERTDVDRAFSLGANSYLTKPHTGQELLEVIDLVQRYWGGLNIDPTVRR